MCNTSSHLLPLQVENELLTMEPKDRPAPRWSLGSGSGLHYGSFVNSLSSLTPSYVEEKQKPVISQRRAYVAVAVLCYVNLLNYMERYTIAGQVTVSVHDVVHQHCLLLLICITFVLQASCPTSRSSLISVTVQLHFYRQVR